jgi:hypothetical protein
MRMAVTIGARHEIATIESLCDAELFACCCVLALTIADARGYCHDLRNCSIGAWLLTWIANGEADGAD